MNVKPIQQSLKESINRNIDIYLEQEKTPLTPEKAKEIAASAVNNQAAEWAMRMVEVPDDYDMVQVAIAHIEKASVLLNGGHLSVRSMLWEAAQMLKTSSKEPNGKGQ